MSESINLSDSNDSIAGKVILLGEYAVLTGLPALVAAIPPRFKMRSALRLNSRGFDFQEHPRSPLGRLRAWANREGWPDLVFDFF